MKLLKKIACLSLAISAISHNCYSLDIPYKSVYDGRVRFVNYNPDDVTLVHTVLGIGTIIVLEDDERYVTHSFGDPNAWDITNTLNYVFIKAVAEYADTNLHLVTNKRLYSFKIIYHHDLNAKAYYQVKFRYPELELTKRQKEAEEKAIKTAFTSEGGIYNLSYSMSGDTDIAPINIWDDGVFTHFKFAGNKDIPTIYMVDEDNNESVVNKHAQGKRNDIVVMHKVAKEWVIRADNRALAIFNEAFNDRGYQTDTGTKSSRVLRVIKDKN